jgi:hypothetical protein
MEGDMRNIREYCTSYKNVSNFRELATIKLQRISCNWNFITVKSMEYDKTLKTFATFKVEVFHNTEKLTFPSYKEFQNFKTYMNSNISKIPV